MKTYKQEESEEKGDEILTGKTSSGLTREEEEEYSDNRRAKVVVRGRVVTKGAGKSLWVRIES